MGKKCLADGRRKKDYGNKIIVRLSDQQVTELQRLSWLGENLQCIAYFLIIDGLRQRCAVPKVINAPKEFLPAYVSAKNNDAKKER